MKWGLRGWITCYVTWMLSVFFEFQSCIRNWSCVWIRKAAIYQLYKSMLLHPLLEEKSIFRSCIVLKYWKRFVTCEEFLYQCKIILPFLWYCDCKKELHILRNKYSQSKRYTGALKNIARQKAQRTRGLSSYHKLLNKSWSNNFRILIKH